MNGKHAQTKRELVRAISAKLGASTTGVNIALVIDALFDEIRETVSAGERVELRGFGVFEPKSRRARLARNPKTGAVVTIPAKIAVTFKAGKEFKEKMPKPVKQPAAPPSAASPAPRPAPSLLTTPPAPSVISVPPGNPPGVIA